jgi:hypothetical protein
VCHWWFVEAVFDENPEKEVKDSRAQRILVVKVSFHHVVSKFRAADYRENSYGKVW